MTRLERDLRAQLEEEMSQLAAETTRFGIIEAGMRMRALAEIAHNLTTEALIDLAVDVTRATECLRPSDEREGFSAAC